MGQTWASNGQRSVKVTCTSGTEVPASPVKASQTVAFSSAVAGNYAIIGGHKFVAIANGGTPSTIYEFAVGAGGSANTDTGAAFAKAVNASPLSLTFTAVNATGTVTLTANDYGSGQNSIALTKSGTPITLGGAAFVSGVDVVGANISGCSYVEVFLEATSGQTVASGSIACFKLNEKTGLWSRVGALDIALSSTTYRCQGGSLKVDGRIGYYAWLPAGVTISSGNAICYINARAQNGDLI